MKVKICGIRRVEDALAACAAGADAIGVLVGQKHFSKDFIDVNNARSIITALPPLVSSVLVTHEVDRMTIDALLSFIQPTTLQLHAESTVEDIEWIRTRFPFLKILKSIHITGIESLKTAQIYAPYVNGLLLDSINNATNQIGGTGKTHDWSISTMIVEAVSCSSFLAGGLNPENIQLAIQTVRPYGVDINSGTKAEDGFKSTDKMIEFVTKAKTATY